MLALRIVTQARCCVVPLNEVELLTAELRRLPDDAYPAALLATTILETAAVEETTADVTLASDEEAAVRCALQGLEVSLDLLPAGLQCLWDGLRIDRGVI